MSTTIELPDFWVLFNPEGRADGSLHPASGGVVRYATAEQAHAHFTPRAARREAEIAQGWRVVGVEQADWRDYWDGVRLLGQAPSDASTDRDAK